jgi:isoaspartyl peptidase/L-asparaginase-like protein (Ntn-hydrolase superfamily)
LKWTAGFNTERQRSQRRLGKRQKRKGKKGKKGKKEEEWDKGKTRKGTDASTVGGVARDTDAAASAV